MRTPGGSIIFKPINSGLGVRCEAVWGVRGDNLWISVNGKCFPIWGYVGAKDMRSVRIVQDALIECGMSAADIERVRFV